MKLLTLGLQKGGFFNYEAGNLYGQCGYYKNKAGSGEGNAPLFYGALWKSLIHI